MCIHPPAQRRSTQHVDSSRNPHCASTSTTTNINKTLIRIVLAAVAGCSGVDAAPMEQRAPTHRVQPGALHAHALMLLCATTRNRKERRGAAAASLLPAAHQHAETAVRWCCRAELLCAPHSTAIKKEKKGRKYNFWVGKSILRRKRRVCSSGTAPAPPLAVTDRAGPGLHHTERATAAANLDRPAVQYELVCSGASVPDRRREACLVCTHRRGPPEVSASRGGAETAIFFRHVGVQLQHRGSRS